MGFHVELVWSDGLKERLVIDVPEQLNEAIDFAKDEYNYCLDIDNENIILSASVINEQTDLVVWSTDDAPELKRYEEYTHDEWHTILHGHHPKCYNPSVYFDIDGTLGYWYPDGRGYTLDQILDPTTHYFRDIEPHPLMIDLAKMLYNRGLDVCIISAAGKDTIRDKWEWIDKYLPFIPKGNICFSPLGADKNNYVKGNAEYSILIDDYWVNLDNWKGISIKAINTVNSHQNKYPEIDFTKLEAVLNEEASYYDINPFNVKRSMMAIYEVSKAADRIEKIINELLHKHKLYVMEYECVKEGSLSEFVQKIEAYKQEDLQNLLATCKRMYDIERE